MRTPDFSAPGRSAAGAAAAVAGLVLMRLFFSVYPVYLPCGPDILSPVGQAGWKGIASPGVSFTGAGGDVVLRLAASSNVMPAVEYPVPSLEGVEAFMVRARFSTERLVQGRWGFQVGRVALAFVDRSGKSRWDWPHVAGAMDGTRSWRTIARRFIVPGEAASARVVLHNYGRSGVLAVTDLSVVPMRMNPWTPPVFALWGLTWAAGVGVATRRLRLASRPRGWAVLAAALAVVVGMLLPERAIAVVGTGIRHMLTDPERSARVSPTVPATGAPPASAVAQVREPKPRPDAELRAALSSSLDVHKAGHLVVFAWLTLAAAACFGLGLPVRGRTSVRGVAGLVLYAFAAEQLQWLTLTRTAKVADVGVNLVGIAVGLLLAEAWRALRRRPAGRLRGGDAGRA